MTKRKTTTDVSRRAFVQKAAYVAPLILTFKAVPAFAKPGSNKKPKVPTKSKSKGG